MNEMVFMAGVLVEQSDSKLAIVESNIRLALKVAIAANKDLKDSWSFDKIILTANTNENLFLIRLHEGKLAIIDYLHYVNRYVLPTLKKIDYASLDKTEKKAIKERVKELLVAIKEINRLIRSIVGDSYAYTRNKILNETRPDTGKPYGLFAPGSPFDLQKFKTNDAKRKATDSPFLTELIDLYRIIEEHCTLLRDLKNKKDIEGRKNEILKVRDFVGNPSHYGPIGIQWRIELEKALYSSVGSKYFTATECNEIVFWPQNGTITIGTYEKLLQFVRSITLPEELYAKLDKETKVPKIANIFRELYLDGTFYYVNLAQQSIHDTEEKLRDATKELHLGVLDNKPRKIGMKEKVYKKVTG